MGHDGIFEGYLWVAICIALAFVWSRELVLRCCFLLVLYCAKGCGVMNVFRVKFVEVFSLPVGVRLALL